MYSSDCGIAGNLPLLSISYATRESITNGVYYIRNHNSGKYIDVIGQSTESAKTIHQWNFHGAPCQQWKITHVGNNWYTIRPQHAPNMAMDVYNNSSGNGVKVQQFTYHGRDNQQFGFYKQSNDGTYRIVTKSSLGTRNLSVQSASTANGAIIHQYGYGGANDFWWLEKAETKNLDYKNEKVLSYAIPVGDETMGTVIPYAVRVEQDVSIVEHRSPTQKSLYKLIIISHHDRYENPELTGVFQFNNSRLTIDNLDCTNLLKEREAPNIIPSDWLNRHNIVWDGDEAYINKVYNINTNYSVSILTTLIVPNALFTYGESDFKISIN